MPARDSSVDENWKCVIWDRSTRRKQGLFLNVNSDLPIHFNFNFHKEFTLVSRFGSTYRHNATSDMPGPKHKSEHESVSQQPSSTKSSSSSPQEASERVQHQKTISEHQSITSGAFSPAHMLEIIAEFIHETADIPNYPSLHSNGLRFTPLGVHSDAIGPSMCIYHLCVLKPKAVHRKKALEYRFLE